MAPVSRVLPATEVTSALWVTQGQVFSAEFLDEGSRNQSNQGNGQQLQDSFPGKKSIQRSEGGQDGACLHADKIVWNQTDKHGEEKLHNGDVQNRGRQVQEPIWCHGEESEEQQEKEQAISVLLHLLLQQGHFIGKVGDDQLFAKNAGKQVAACGTHRRQHTAQQKSQPWPKQGTSQNIQETGARDGKALFVEVGTAEEQEHIGLVLLPVLSKDLGELPQLR